MMDRYGYRPLILSDPEASTARTGAVRADTGAFGGWDDPALIEFVKLGLESASGAHVTVERALRNPAMFRAVTRSRSM